MNRSIKSLVIILLILLIIIGIWFYKNAEEKEFENKVTANTIEQNNQDFTNMANTLTNNENLVQNENFENMVS